MRLTHALPLPSPGRRDSGTRGFSLTVPTESVAEVVKRIALIIAFALGGPMLLLIALMAVAMLVLTTWPAWIATAPVLGLVWLLDQMIPATADRR